MPDPQSLVIEPTWSVIVSVIVLYIGRMLTSRIRFLQDFNIPNSVVGGLICSTVIAVIFFVSGKAISFDLSLRDTLLLVFFSTVGLSARFKTLLNGGKSLAILVVCAIGFLVVQNLAGIGVAALLGVDHAYGLIAGSIAFAGGHGSAISYGQLAANEGLPGAMELGLACATFGLVAGGLIGGPIGRHLISRNKLSGDISLQEGLPGPEIAVEGRPVTLNGTLDSIFVLAICLGAGALMNQWLGDNGPSHCLVF